MERVSEEQSRRKKVHILSLNKNKIHPARTKGVGGYRPVINWREISFRRKKIADRQILFCILSSGLGIVLVGSLLLCIGIFVVGIQCPKNWTVTSNGCLHLSAINVTWYEARERCVEQGANMLELRTAGDVKNYVEYLRRPSWSGLSRNVGKDIFKWESGNSLDYNNFQTNPDQSAQHLRECVYALSTGEWQVASSCLDNISIACVYDKSYTALILIGPMFILVGALVMILSIELCHTKKDISKKTSFLLEKQKLPKQVPTAKDNAGLKNEFPTNLPISSTLQVEEGRRDSNTGHLVAGLISPVTEQTPSQDQLELLLSPKNLS